MTDSEKLQRLIDMTHCSAEEAENALEAGGGDLLDAVLIIERTHDASFPEPGGGQDGDTYSAQQKKNHNRNSSQTGKTYADSRDIKEGFAAFGRFLLRIVNAANDNKLVVTYRGGEILTLPVSLVIVLLLSCFWWFVPFMIIAMFFGWRYSFSGEHLGRQDINDAMNKAGDFAGGVREKLESMDPHRKPAEPVDAPADDTDEPGEETENSDGNAEPETIE